MTLKEIRDCAFTNAQQLTSGAIVDFRLEQVESEKTDWDVIVSFLTTNVNQPEPMTGILGMAQGTQKTPYERVFKRMILDRTGTLKKILMYKG